MALLRQTILCDGSLQQAYFYPVFLRSSSVVELSCLIICASGKIICHEEEYSVADVQKLISTHHLRTSLTAGERVLVGDLITFKITDVLPVVQEEEFVKEIADLIRDLNGLPTTSDMCRTAYTIFLASPTEPNRLRVQQAYEDVPQHLRCWLLQFGEKDAPIRRAISSRQ